MASMAAAGIAMMIYSCEQQVLLAEVTSRRGVLVSITVRTRVECRRNVTMGQAA